MYYSKQHKHTKNINTIYYWSLSIGILLIVAAIPLSFVLPVSVSFENSWLENLQVVALIVGGIFNFKLIRQSSDHQIADFHIWSTVMTAFMTFREVSWGRVLYPYTFNDKGPVFVGMKDFAWKTEAQTLIILFIAFLVVFGLRRLPWKRLLRCRLPFLIMVLMLICVVFSKCGDHGFILGRLQGQIVEEFAELAFYTMIPALCIHYRRELSKI